jgi:hypothetical protein
MLAYSMKEASLIYIVYKNNSYNNNDYEVVSIMRSSRNMRAAVIPEFRSKWEVKPVWFNYDYVKTNQIKEITKQEP